MRTAQMDESLGRFDEMIRNEREQIARERDEQGGGDAAGDGSGDGSADGTASGDEESSGSASEEKSGEKQGEQRSPGDMKSDKQAAGGTGATTGQGQGATGKDIPDGSDDDIIARQIREAAEKETDPELKEKLWKEYIEYKKNAQKK